MITEQMFTEWRAWQGICTELRELMIEPNDPESQRLIDSIKAWGEELVRLRAEQQAAGCLAE